LDCNRTELQAKFVCESKSIRRIQKVIRGHETPPSTWLVKWASMKS